MKFRTRTEPFTEDVTIDGKTHKVERTREFRVPDAPRDWDQFRSRAGAVGTGLVVVGALAWSVVSIGSLLSALAPTWLAYTIAAVFDLAWILAMNLEHELRFEPAKQRVPKLFGWALLAVSVAVIFVHGLQVADVVVAIAGSAIAVLAKLLWNMRVWATTRELGEATRGWLAADMDEAHATLAMITQRRKIALVRARADAALRALGAEHPTEHRVEQLAPNETPVAPPGRAVAVPQQYHGTPTDSHGTAGATPPQAGGGATGVPASHAGLTEEEGVAALVNLIRKDQAPSISQAVEIFGKPKSTVARWLRKARAEADANTGQYL